VGSLCAVKDSIDSVRACASQKIGTEGHERVLVASRVYAPFSLPASQTRTITNEKYTAIKSNLQTNMFAKPGLLEEGLSRAKAAEEKEGREWTRDPQKTLQQGCSTTLVAALDLELEMEGKNGEYLVNGDVSLIPPPEWASSVENQERLWRLSEELVGERFEF
jgi:hypothetical protein